MSRSQEESYNMNVILRLSKPIIVDFSSGFSSDLYLKKR